MVDASWVEPVLVTALATLLLALAELARRWARDLDARDEPREQDTDDLP